MALSYIKRPRPPLTKSGVTVRGVLALVVVGPCALLGGIQQLLFADESSSRLGALLIVMVAMGFACGVPFGFEGQLRIRGGLEKQESHRDSSCRECRTRIGGICTAVPSRPSSGLILHGSPQQSWLPKYRQISLLVRDSSDFDDQPCQVAQVRSGPDQPSHPRRGPQRAWPGSPRARAGLVRDRPGPGVQRACVSEP